MSENEKRSVLSEEEKVERANGQDLFEMTNTQGYQVLKSKLQELAFHSWVDPREVPNKEEFLWRELNGFHGANNAKELLEWIQSSISRAEYLEKKRRGEVSVRPFSIN